MLDVPDILNWVAICGMDDFRDDVHRGGGGGIELVAAFVVLDPSESHIGFVWMPG